MVCDGIGRGSFGSSRRMGTHPARIAGPLPRGRTHRWRTSSLGAVDDQLQRTGAACARDRGLAQLEGRGQALLHLASAFTEGCASSQGDCPPRCTRRCNSSFCDGSPVTKMTRISWHVRSAPAVDRGLSDRVFRDCFLGEPGRGARLTQACRCEHPVRAKATTAITLYVMFPPFSEGETSTAPPRQAVGAAAEGRADAARSRGRAGCRSSARGPTRGSCWPRS